MAVVTGTKGASGTPASDLYGEVATELTANANWTSIHTITAANAGTTGDVEVWKCTATGTGNYYVFFEKDDTNAHLRVRVAEYYNENASSPRIRQPAAIGGTAATAGDNTSVTPTANSTVTDSDTTLTSTNPMISHATVPTAGGGYFWLVKVENKLVTVATRSGGVNRFAVAGAFTSLASLVSDNNPVMLGAHGFDGMGSTATQSTSVHRPFAVVTRALARTVAEVGAFTIQPQPLHAALPHNDGTNNPVVAADARFSGAPRYHTNALISQAVLHRTATGSKMQNLYRGYLPGFVAAVGNGTEPPVGDTVVVGGQTYWWLGICGIVPQTSQTADAAGRMYYLAVKDS